MSSALKIPKLNGKQKIIKLTKHLKNSHFCAPTDFRL